MNTSFSKLSVKVVCKNAERTNVETKNVEK